MTHLKKVLSLLGCYLIGVTSISALAGETKTVFTSPGKLCFPQTNLRAEPNKYNSVMLDHYVIVPKEHHFKNGSIFVGFKLKSRPDDLWLFSGTEWVKYTNDILDSIPIQFIHQTQTPSGLQPVMPTTISIAPIDASTYIDDGEIWVGYGLVETSGGNAFTAFNEMVNNNRFERIWEIGKGLPTGDSSPDHICLTITEMVRIDHLVGTNPPNDKTSGPDTEPVRDIEVNP